MVTVIPKHKMCKTCKFYVSLRKYPSHISKGRLGYCIKRGRETSPYSYCGEYKYKYYTYKKKVLLG